MLVSSPGEHVTEPKNLTIVTANTQFRLLEPEDSGIQEAVQGADILLLQEVVNPYKEHVDDRLQELGFTLVAAAGEYALALAVRTETDAVAVIPNTNRKQTLGRMGFLEAKTTQKLAGRSHDFNARGVISVDFETPFGPITAATAHPTVPLKPHTRDRQIEQLGRFAFETQKQNPLVLGGDMNHWHGPKLSDWTMRSQTGLEAIETVGPTWFVEGSDVERVLRIVACIRRLPLGELDGYHDTILYSKTLQSSDTRVVRIPSDHAALITTLSARDEL